MTTKQMLFSAIILGLISNNMIALDQDKFYIRVGYEPTGLIDYPDRLYKIDQDSKTKFFDHGELTLVNKELLLNTLYNSTANDHIRIVRYYTHRTGLMDYPNAEYEDEGLIKELKENIKTEVVVLPWQGIYVTKNNWKKIENREEFIAFSTAINLNNAAFCPEIQCLIYSPYEPLPRHDLCAQLRRSLEVKRLREQEWKQKIKINNT